MRAISLWQPWATAIAVGVKSIETRHWKTDYRGPLAIHAAKRFDKHQREFAQTEHTLGRLPGSLPLGAIVAVVTLKDCQPTAELVHEVSPIERIFGDFHRGRWAWLLEDIRSLDEPIPFAGRQGFFNVPDEPLLKRIRT